MRFGGRVRWIEETGNYSTFATLDHVWQGPAHSVENAFKVHVDGFASYLRVGVSQMTDRI